MGSEPTNGGFADLSLGPLGYRAESISIAKSPSSVRASNQTIVLKYRFISLAHTESSSRALPAKIAPTPLAALD